MNKRFVLHFVEMLIAMLAGMMLIGALTSWIFDMLGWSEALGGVEASALVMATNMTIGMSLWMLVRRHGWGAIAEMALAMYLPFVVLFVPYWAGIGSGHLVMVGGHILMVPAMLLAMLRRKAEYSGHHHSDHSDSGPDSLRRPANPSSTR